MMMMLMMIITNRDLGQKKITAVRGKPGKSIVLEKDMS